MTDPLLITVDGPSASGKSSTSALLAQNLGWPWVSTGAFYRGLALVLIKKNWVEDMGRWDLEAWTSLAQDPIWKVEMDSHKTRIFFMNSEVTGESSGEKVGHLTSKISAIPFVRQALLIQQRNCFDPKKGLVAEGRDCGTVVFPQAPLKVYLTARQDTRAHRRSTQESTQFTPLSSPPPLDLGKTLKMQQDRDQRDWGRSIAPLKVPEGALEIDSSELSLEEVVKQILHHYDSYK